MKCDFKTNLSIFLALFLLRHITTQLALMLQHLARSLRASSPLMVPMRLFLRIMENAFYFFNHLYASFSSNYKTENKALFFRKAD